MPRSFTTPIFWSKAKLAAELKKRPDNGAELLSWIEARKEGFITRYAVAYACPLLGTDIQAVKLQSHHWRAQSAAPRPVPKVRVHAGTLLVGSNSGLQSQLGGTRYAEKTGIVKG